MNHLLFCLLNHHGKASKSSLKRGPGTLGVSELENRPPKRKCAISSARDNTDWFKSKIKAIKGSIGEAEARLKDANDAVEDLLCALE